MNYIDPQHPHGKGDNSSARVRGARGPNRAAASGRLRADRPGAFTDQQFKQWVTFIIRFIYHNAFIKQFFKIHDPQYFPDLTFFAIFL